MGFISASTALNNGLPKLTVPRKYGLDVTDKTLGVDLRTDFQAIEQWANNLPYIPQGVIAYFTSTGTSLSYTAYTTFQYIGYPTPSIAVTFTAPVSGQVLLVGTAAFFVQTGGGSGSATGWLGFFDATSGHGYGPIGLGFQETNGAWSTGQVFPCTYSTLVTGLTAGTSYTVALGAAVAITVPASSITIIGNTATRNIGGSPPAYTAGPITLTVIGA